MFSRKNLKLLKTIYIKYNKYLPNWAKDFVQKKIKPTLIKKNKEYLNTNVLESFDDLPNFPILSKQKFDIVIVTAFYKRHEILEMIIDESFNTNLEIRWILVGSDFDDQYFVHKLAIKYPGKIAGYMFPNKPLGSKWQIGVEIARNIDFNLLGIVGSDDLITKKSYEIVLSRFKHLEKYSKEKIGLFCFNDWFVKYNSRIVKTQYYKDSFQPVGAGRFYTNNFLKDINYQLFDISLNRLLDDHGWKQIKKNHYHYDILNTEDSGSFISIKTGVDEMNSFEQIINSENLLTTKLTIKDKENLKKFLSDFNYNILFNKHSNFFY